MRSTRVLLLTLPAGVMRVRRGPHGGVGAVVARLVAVPDRHELRHSKTPLVQALSTKTDLSRS
jgi:hypothetical protein